MMPYIILSTIFVGLAIAYAMLDIPQSCFTIVTNMVERLLLEDADDGTHVIDQRHNPHQIQREGRDMPK